MRRTTLEDSGARGWFIGDWHGAAVRTDQFEVNWQTNPRGQIPSHFHKVVTEIQLITRGCMLVNGQIFHPGDIFILEPGDMSQIEFLEETDTVCIKMPSLPEDKYPL
jgi:quercetin dioxygenase-like cupin family protein